MYLSQEEIKELVNKLKEYYPDRAEEASNILIQEYELPLAIASTIMYLVRTLVEGQNWFNWPVLNAKEKPFFMN